MNFEVPILRKIPLEFFFLLASLYLFLLGGLGRIRLELPVIED